MTTIEYRIAAVEQHALAIERIVSEMDSLLFKGGQQCRLDKLARKAIIAARNIEKLLA
jgi:hypothetical protein